MRKQWGEIVGVGVLLLGGLAAFGSLLALPTPHDVELAGYATSLRGRTPGQRHNALLAAQSLDGLTIAPGSTFSFNRKVRSWSQDQGYVKAPVSYDGELIKAFGGGVCQTSTTLYNTALLAGLPIVERHPHVFAPHYVPPGRDAAVAQETIDLRFRNPYAWPIRIQTRAEGDRLDIRLYGLTKPASGVSIEREVLQTDTPQRWTRTVRHASGFANGKAFVRNPGAEGCRVVTYRVFEKGGEETRRERLSDDSYDAMNRIVQMSEE